MRVRNRIIKLLILYTLAQTKITYNLLQSNLFCPGTTPTITVF